ncbi:MAG: hypothetical protein IPG45_38855 [Deltaproteobacteria bacterium]|nr:hypothetical protein [Deltaproteobacteria bacterium]
MNEPKKRVELGRAILRGRTAGAHLAARGNPTFFVSDGQLSDALALLDQAEARLRDDAPLWEREWISMAARGVRLAVGRRPEHQATLARCQQVLSRLEAIDRLAFAEVRARLARGELRPSDLEKELEGRPNVEWDAYVQRLFEVSEVPEAEAERPAKMVHYLPSPFTSILELTARVGPNDVFYDVGSGLGLVTVLVAWMTGARAKGLEREPAYHRQAEALAARFPVLRVEPILGDAREHDYRDATVVYVYDTFRDELLDQLLIKLAAVAADHPLVVVSRGRSSPQIRAQTWLTEVEVTRTGLTVFKSA